ncbi:ABC transporter substrate-binding protein [Paenirhodobacter populi]|uniref:ABC transporter substrate-binding protein n=1 Tax=Paenirhodobacter populi TaxID=2306993 RepID=UPI000FE2E7A0|nr:PotD/PotF family extracellular solute-binding protein [Sinirhodobacter populi]RWR05480.1 extracellular solute-binding protein [Sinirhodobacter populi]
MTDSIERRSSPVRATRRRFLEVSAASAALLATPWVRRAEAATIQMRALMWGSYLMPDVIAEYEKTYDVSFSPTFFDGNSEAYNKLRVGGTRDFDLVQADGFWPSLYYREGLIRAFDYAAIRNTAHYYPAFQPSNFRLLVDAPTGATFGVPYCWGGYGITYNMSRVDPEKVQSLEILFAPEMAGQLLTSARFEENIAVTGILVSAEMGTQTAPRPDGKPFNPYVLTDEELAEVERRLIAQKSLLLTRYPDNQTLASLLQAGAATTAAEFSQSYRKLNQMNAAGEIPDKFGHVLRPKEGALGWIDTWLISSGVQDGPRLDAAMGFIDMMISPELMAKLAREAGSCSTIDWRADATDLEKELFLMDRSDDIASMHQFDQPSSPEKWERVWSNMQAA